MEYLAAGGWVMAIFFMFAYHAAQSKLVEYRTDSMVLGTLRRRYESVDRDAKQVESLLGEGVYHE